MTVTERLMKPGQFTIKLRKDAPMSAWSRVSFYDHIVILPTRLPQIGAVSDAAILSAAIYTGVVIDKPSPTEISGQGLAYWLGDDDGIGDLTGNAATTQSAATLTTWINALRPISLSAGTVTNTGSPLTFTYQWMTRREAIDHACRWFGAEWRINANGTLDAAAPATLFSRYTTPDTVITRKAEGTEGTLKGLEAVDITLGGDVKGYTTQVVAVGKIGADQNLVTTATATAANVYKDFAGNNLQRQRLVNCPDGNAGFMSAYANTMLGLYSSQRRSIRLSTKTHAVPTKVRPGDQVWVHDPAAGVIDAANKIMWRGQQISPVKLRCKSYTWAVTQKHGVYLRHWNGAGFTYYDLSEYVDPETSPTVWEVGTSVSDVEQDTEQLGGAFLGVNPDIVNRLNMPAPVSFTPTFWFGATQYTAGTVTATFIRNGYSIDVLAQLTLSATAPAAGTFTMKLAGFTLDTVNRGFDVGGGAVINHLGSEANRRPKMTASDAIELRTEADVAVTNTVPYALGNGDTIRIALRGVRVA